MSSVKAPAAYDVIVVGAGLAGHMAALAAAERGCDVLLVEKMAAIGGSTVVSGGSWAFAGTAEQALQNIQDNAELFRKDLWSAGNGESDPEHLDAFIDRQLAEYEYLRGLGIEFGPVQASSGQSVPRTHPADAVQVMVRLGDQVRLTGRVEIRLECSAQRLIYDDAVGAVAGVIIRDHGESATVVARRGVVLTSGGFARSERLIRDFVPSLRSAVRSGGHGNQGDGILMACALGAGLRDIGFIKGTFGAHLEPDAGGQFRIILPIYRGGIAVNLDGKRFADESGSYKKLASACLSQPKAMAYQIFDQSIMETASPGVPSFDFAAAEAKGLIVRGDTLANLATIVGLPAPHLINTIQAYNTDVLEGYDREYGRRTLSSSQGKPIPIERAPFYAYPCTVMCSTTYGGIDVAANASVRDVFGNAIPGLYAAGEVTGGFHGDGYLTGSYLTKALVFGRLAGNEAAKNKTNDLGERHGTARG